MSDTSKLDDLLAQVEALKGTLQVAERDTEFQQLEAERCKAIARACHAEEERDNALAELKKLKADSKWTMGKLIISDFLFYARGKHDLACAGEGFLPFDRDPQDTERIEWINKHCRMGVSDHHWLISIPHKLTLEEDLPEPYNIRDIIDLSRLPPPPITRTRAPAPEPKPEPSEYEPQREAIRSELRRKFEASHPERE